MLSASVCGGSGLPSASAIFSGSKTAPLPSKSGVFVYGYLPELKWSEWQKWLVDHKLDNLKSGNQFKAGTKNMMN